MVGTDGFTSPPKDAVMNTSSFLRVELSILIGEKSLYLVGLEVGLELLYICIRYNTPLSAL